MFIYNVQNKITMKTIRSIVFHTLNVELSQIFSVILEGVHWNTDYYVFGRMILLTKIESIKHQKKCIKYSYILPNKQK